MPHRLSSSLLFIACLVTPAAAQTGSALMLTPWGDPQADAEPQLELNGSGRFPTDGQVETSDDSMSNEIQMSVYDIGGRFRFNTDRGAPTAGFEFGRLELKTLDPALPQELTDMAVNLGTGLGEVGGWGFAVTGGIGAAGDEPFDDEDAIYYHGSLIANREIALNESLQIGLEYDGNRVIFPDVPLPFISYNKQVSNNFRYSIGLPYSSVTYKPADRVTFELSSIVLVDYSGEMRYRIDERLSVYGSYESDTRAYHREGDKEHRRLFYSTQRAETGVRYHFPEAPGSQLIVAGGYSFDREFATGFDVTGDNRIRALTSEPYFRGALEIAF